MNQDITWYFTKIMFPKSLAFNFIDDLDLWAEGQTVRACLIRMHFVKRMILFMHCTCIVIVDLNLTYLCRVKTYMIVL